MTYIIPHIRYGALVHLITEETAGKERSKRRARRDRIQRILHRTIKELYGLPKSTPNEVLKKILGNWNIETLSTASYSKNA